VKAVDTLFDLDVYPPGFQWWPNFISPGEEEELLSLVRGIQLKNFEFKGYVANRRIASFGYDYSFTDGRLHKGAPIPPNFSFLIERVARQLDIHPASMVELLVTEYPPGTVINWHCDAPPFDRIAGISLQSDCTFKLRPHDKQKQKRNAIINIVLPRRSLYVMQDEARTLWQHSIAPVKKTRYSITLRTLRKV